MLTALRSLLFRVGRGVSDLLSIHRESQAQHRGSLMIRSWPVGTTPGDPPIPRSLPLPLLTHLETLEASDWVRESLTTFGRSVASFLPGDFAAYARVYHHFDLTASDGVETTSSWRDLPHLAGRDIGDPLVGEDIAMNGLPDGQRYLGSPPRSLIEVLVEHLRLATTTPDECYFAVWEGFGGLAINDDLLPKLQLPGRGYHVFSGPLMGALTNYDAYSFGRHGQFANLWWPADHAWFVATEIDFAWTYVGGSRTLIDGVLADSRLEAMETSAHARW